MFDYIERYGPRSQHSNTQLQWVQQQFISIKDSPIKAWPERLIKETLKNLMNDDGVLALLVRDLEAAHARKHPFESCLEASDLTRPVAGVAFSIAQAFRNVTLDVGSKADVFENVLFSILIIIWQRDGCQLEITKGTRGHFGPERCAGRS